MHPLGRADFSEAWDKGKKLAPNPNKTKYTCEVTGAHFNHREMCRRIDELVEIRKSGIDTFVKVALNCIRYDIESGDEASRDIAEPQRVANEKRKQARQTAANGHTTGMQKSQPRQK
jgi:hypothetical protein